MRHKAQDKRCKIQKNKRHKKRDKKEMMSQEASYMSAKTKTKI